MGLLTHYAKRKAHSFASTREPIFSSDSSASAPECLAACERTNSRQDIATLTGFCSRHESFRNQGEVVFL